ncbi:DNA repair protein RecO, partial [Bacillus velezensis]
FEKDPYRVPISPQTARLLRLFYYFDIGRLGSVSLKQETKNEIKRVIDLYYEEYSGLYLKSKRFLDQMESMKNLLDENKS